MKYTDWTSGEPVEKEWTDQPTPRTEADAADRPLYTVGDMQQAFERGAAQARTEALDVDAVARALHHINCGYSDHRSESAETAHGREATALIAYLAEKSR